MKEGEREREIKVMSFTTHPHPPPHQQRPLMLSFRSFHERHFSPSQRQAFFSSVPYPWFPAPPHTFQQTGEGDDQVPDPEDVEEDDEGTHALQEEEEEADMLPPQLTKEAIEIFEFSRRFREEKERAAQLEKARTKRRRIKRQKLTELGFAFDEGNSEAEEDSDAKVNRRSGGGVGPQEEDVQLSENDDEQGYEDGDGDEDEDEEGEDSDYEISRMEPPATDVSFMNQGTRRKDKTRQRLYGQVNGTSQSASSAEGIRTIEILEGILNQTYLDSLGPQAFNPETTERDQDADDVRGQRRPRRKEPGNRPSQVVYWPGMPLRC